jgi:hypothetical protein
MGEYIWLVAGLSLVVAFFVALYIFQRRRSGTGAGHSWASYLLLWPLVLDADKEKREGRFLTKREWIGWGIVVLIMLFVAVFTVSRRGN